MTETPQQLLRRMRLQLQLTQAEVAKRMGVTQQAYAKLESRLSNPTLGGLVRAFDALGVVMHLDVKPKARMRR